MALNETWALDFMADALYGGRWFRTLNVIDEGNRQALGIEQLIEMHGNPKVSVRSSRMDLLVGSDLKVRLVK